MLRPRSRTRGFAATTGLAALALVTSLASLPAVAQEGAAPITSAGSGDASHFAPVDAIAPQEGAYGHFTQSYRNNTPDHMTVDSNPAIGVLHRMHDYWTPGQSWNDGTVLDRALHEQNIRQVEQITQARTTAEGEWAYVMDRRHQSYSMIEGLGADAEAFKALTNAGTTVTGIPDYAYERSQSDEGNNNGRWADPDAQLGSAVQLVNTVRGNYATSNRSKEYWQYMRPFRWSDDVEVEPALVARILPEEDAINDGGFPSGHTNAAFLAGYGLAVAAPEHYSEIMLTAAEAGYSRVVAGVHSPLDVIGGRMLATGLAGATLADPENQTVAEAARTDMQRLIAPEADLSVDREAYQADLARFLQLTSFDFEDAEVTWSDVRVPAGAESLLETRYPYLDQDQLRWVLYSTALDSGISLLDDDEGWGRTNLFAAANGFGAFDLDVSVELDGDAGGFSRADIWRNDISGPGGLTKAGSGELVLAGENSFAGGVLVREGSLVAGLGSALGTGDVEVLGGELRESVDGTVVVDGDFALAETARLVLTQESQTAPALQIAGEAHLGGVLQLDLSELSGSADGLLVIAHNGAEGAFDRVEITGSTESWEVDYRADGVYLVAEGGGVPSPSPEPTPSTEPSTPSRPKLPSTGV